MKPPKWGNNQNHTPTQYTMETLCLVFQTPGMAHHGPGGRVFALLDSSDHLSLLPGTLATLQDGTPVYLPEVGTMVAVVVVLAMLI